MLTIRQLLTLLLKNNGVDISTLSLREIIEQARTLFFDFEYPMWTDKPEVQATYGDYRPIFEKLFLKHFLDYKICYDIEDYEEWNLELDGALNLIMPYYNHLLESETWFDKYITNPADNTSYRETYTRSLENESSNKTTNEGNTTSSTNATTDSSSNIHNIDQATTNGKSSNSTASNNETKAHAESGNDTKNVTNDLPKNMVNLNQIGIDGLNYANGLDLSNAKSTSDSTSSTFSNSENTEKHSQTGETESNTESKDFTKSNGDTLTSSENVTKGKTEGSQLEKYEFSRTGNIGTQTPGEVFEKSRKAFINTTKKIFEDKEITSLFYHLF